AHRVNICHFLLFLFVQLSRALPVLHSFPTRRSSDLDVYSEADVEERPHLMSGPPLAYPAPMLLSRISGRVVIEAVIDTTGRVEDGTVRVLVSSDARFNEAAKDYVRAARFTPGRLAGSAVR